MFRHIVSSAALLATLACTAPAAAGDGEFDARVADYRADSGLTGVSLAVYDGFEMVTAVAGTLDGEGSARVTPDTRFYVASSGKSVVAAAILAYVASGGIGLDDPVLPLVGDLAVASRLENIDAVTIRQLLDHTSGLADYLDDAFVERAYEAGADGVPVETALRYALDMPASFAPGAGFAYSNTNYLLLGHILDRLAGSLSTALADKVTRRADMNHSSVGIGTPTGNEARGRVDGVDYSELAWASTYGDGPLVTTASDLALFAHALFGANAIIPGELVAEMVAGSDQEPGYGLGMEIEADALGVFYGHSGGFDGFEADFRYYPGLGVAIAYAANGTSEAETGLIDIIVENHMADW